MKKALIIGIDAYASPIPSLRGCVNDAVALGSMLGRNGDGSPNFSVKMVTSNSGIVSSAVMLDGITKLFAGDAEMALLFFAGHGAINRETGSGYIVSQDGKRGALGISLTEVLALANKAYPHIKSTVIILDCCHSGVVGEISALGNDGQASVIGKGVTILTACNREEGAAEQDGYGLFTSILLDGLSGGSADICGRVTPAGLYSHVDQTLGDWEQRPIYKANVQTFVTLRQVAPKISSEILRQLPKYFPDASHIYQLDPSYEPDRNNIPPELRHIPFNENHVRIFKQLQACNRYGLVVPVGAEHMYYAAIESKGCKLTALGAHYRKLAALGRI